MMYSDTYVKYESYLAEDFAIDTLFLQWVAEPKNKDLCNFWNGFLGKHPHKRLEIEYALFLTKHGQSDVCKSEINGLWEAISSTLSKKPIL